MSKTTQPTQSKPSQNINYTDEQIKKTVSRVIAEIKSDIEDTGKDIEEYDKTKDPLTKDTYTDDPFYFNASRDKSQTFNFTMPPDSQFKELYYNSGNFIYLGISKIFQKGDENIPIILKIKNSDTDYFRSLIKQVVNECHRNYKVVYLSFLLTKLDN